LGGLISVRSLSEIDAPIEAKKTTHLSFAIGIDRAPDFAAVQATFLVRKTPLASTSVPLSTAQPCIPHRKREFGNAISPVRR
jgi:hypothetical protein